MSKKEKVKKVKENKYKSKSVGSGKANKERHAKSNKTKNPTAHALFVEHKKQRNLENYKKRANTENYDGNGKFRMWEK